MAGGAQVGGTTILETPPYILALVFTFFLVVTLSFEHLLHWIQHALEHRNKKGLLAAMRNMTNELMLLGVATLILLVFQNNITKVCVQAKRYVGSTWLDHVDGCACCLSRTNGVSECFLQSRGCIPPMNSDYSNPDALTQCCEEDDAQVCNAIDSNSWLPSEDNFTDPEPMNDGGRRLFAASKGPTAVPHCAGSRGKVPVGWEECPIENSRPAIGTVALHQVHLFIFTLAVVHIIVGILCILIASTRLWGWKRWKAADEASGTPRAAGPLGLAEQGLSTGQDQDSGVSQAVNGKRDHSAQFDAEETPGAYQPSRPQLMRLTTRLPSDAANVRISEDFLEEEERRDRAALDEEKKIEAESYSDIPNTLAIKPKRPQGTSSWSNRQQDKLETWGAFFKELFFCLLHQLWPIHIVSRSQFSVMRASFYLTHRIEQGTSFDFMSYLIESMEEDFGKIVGLGLAMWVFMIVFILMSTAVGWAIWIFIIIGGFLLAVVNTKLVWIARYVTRGGEAHRLSPDIFWFKRPWLLLSVIKFMLFFVSFVISNTIFFAIQFGAQSCFFSRTGFQGNPIPWWLLFLVDLVYFFCISWVTLPLYSLVVHMGSHYKSDLLGSQLGADLPPSHGGHSKASHQKVGGLRSAFARVAPKHRASGADLGPGAGVELGAVGNGPSPMSAGTEAELTHRTSLRDPNLPLSA